MRNWLINIFKSFFFYKKEMYRRTYDDPFVIQYENKSADDVIGVMFGFNENFGAPNFGNPDCVEIINLQGGSYKRFLAQTSQDRDKIGQWRFQSNSHFQLKQNINLHHVDANGKDYKLAPINLETSKNTCQFQSDILDVNRDFGIDGNSYATFTLKALTTFVISMFPYQKHSYIGYVERSWFKAIKVIYINIKDFLFYRTRNEIKKMKDDFDRTLMFQDSTIKELSNNVDLLMKLATAEKEVADRTDCEEFAPEEEKKPEETPSPDTKESE